MLHDRSFASILRQVGKATNRGGRDDVERRPAAHGVIVL
jgi:hypothetical protein